MTRVVWIIFLLPLLLKAQQEDWLTYYEKSNFKETPRYEETIAYAKKLAGGSSWIHYTTFGKSPQGRDLPLLIVDRNNHFSPDEVKASGNVVFLIQAGIHSGEIDGKDAGFMLIRDLAILKQDVHLLDHVTLLFIPIFNVDGHERFSAYNRANQNGPEEMGWRVTAQNLNLNRDYLKADTPEMQSWLKLYTDWLPDFFADCHVTDGADYQYAITYDIDRHGIQDRGIIDWTEHAYVPPMLKKMEQDGFPTIEYINFRKSRDLQRGLGAWAMPPRFSNGYTAVQNRPGLLIETHVFKDYQTRVSATYDMLKNTIAILNEQYRSLQRVIWAADSLTALPAFRRDSLTVGYKAVNDSVMIDFLGYEYVTVKSDLTGGDWIRYRHSPKTYHIPYFNKLMPAKKIKLPEAYLIPAEWTQIIERLKLHGVQIYVLQHEVTLELPTYRFSEAEWRQRPYEGRHPVRVKSETIVFRRTFPAGSALIDMNQRAAKVIAHILEPSAPDSYVYWGFFDAIFEQKEYVESYVMEERARLMLASNPDLKTEFEEKKKADKEFAANPRKILNWFYQQSPYWDRFKDVYPVGIIYDRSLVDEILQK